MEKKIIKLDDTFVGRAEVKGKTFIKEKESPYGYIYRVEDPEVTNPHYEVFRKEILPICIDFELRVYSDSTFKENYPKKNAFGKIAWTTMTLEKALLYLDTINKKGADGDSIGEH